MMSLSRSLGWVIGALFLAGCGSGSKGVPDAGQDIDDLAAEIADVQIGPDVGIDAPMELATDLFAEPGTDPGVDPGMDSDADTNTDSSLDINDVDPGSDVAETFDAGLPLYVTTPASGWKVTFADEFNGRPCDPNVPNQCPADDIARITTCYGSGSTAAEANVSHNFHAWPGGPTQEALPHLLDLDKCVWSINDHINWIHFTGDAKNEMIAQYHPDMVAVSGGELRLGTRFVGGTGPCGSNTDPENPDGQDCPYLCGAVTSTPFNGSDHAFPKTAGPFSPGDGVNMPSSGRIDIRAKMPFENGNMAALWTWAVNGSPFEQEHDILEYFMNWRNAHHQGDAQYQPGTSGGKGAWVVSSPSDADYRYHEYHVYSMEWKAEQYLRYLFDGHEVVYITHGEVVKFADSVCRPLEVRGNPFFLIFWNLLITYSYAPDASPYGSAQPPDWLHIDWVRLYQTCTVGEPACIEVPGAGICKNPCGGFGTWNGARCVVGTAPGGTEATIIGGQYGYTGDPTCSHGGMASGVGCVLGGPPGGRTPSLFGSTYVVSPVCLPTDGIFNCARPCPQTGAVPDATGCLLANGTHVGPDQCAYGGTYNQVQNACLFLAAPLGQDAFTWAGNAYYEPFPTEPRCDTDATFDGANCYVGPLPAGADPFVSDNRLFLRATCGPVTPASTFFAHTDITPDVKTCP